MTLARHFSRFLGVRPERLHAAAHSHHPWPDVTFSAQQQAWLDAATYQDDKWVQVIFAEILPQAQRHVARVLGLPDPESVVFAANTHELVTRMVSCLPTPLSVLTTDSEFLSFARQASRWEEAGLAKIERVPAEPFASFTERFADAAARGGHHLVLVSHVLFDSAFVVEGLADALGAVADDDTFVVVDGYHGFMALPTDFGPLAGRAFYLAGGYKYAMAGEGCAFAHCPPDYGLRPVDTGWYAGFGALEEGGSQRVGYAPGGWRFAGATFDPTALYRFNAVQRWLAEVDWDVARIHAHVRALQSRFLEALDGVGLSGLSSAQLVPPVAEPASGRLGGSERDRRGHFLTFRTPDAAVWQRELATRQVVTDRRGDRWRVGFGCYHDAAAVDELIARITDAAARVRT